MEEIGKGDGRFLNKKASYDARFLGMFFLPSYLALDLSTTYLFYSEHA